MSIIISGYSRGNFMNNWSVVFRSNKFLKTSKGSRSDEFIIASFLRVFYTSGIRKGLPHSAMEKTYYLWKRTIGYLDIVKPSFD